ncbi:hypothetical protein MJT46_007513 [Ovis ammon polii x Ovis aries]|nr:hypothetical protein MJT46_007513 [Ovis ammon polii x Ovis aries]
MLPWSSAHGSDPEPRETLPLRQQEDLKLSTAEQREARTRESSPAECVETQLVLLQGAPQEASGPLPEEQKALALAPHYNQTPLPSPVPTAVGTTGAGPRDPLRGHRDLRLPFPDTGPAGYWPAHWTYRTSVPAGPPATGTDVPPPQREHPPPPATVPARALAGETETGHELPPLQGEPALAPAQDPDAHDD